MTQGQHVIHLPPARSHARRRVVAAVALITLGALWMGSVLLFLPRRDTPLHTRRACATFERIGYRVTCLASAVRLVAVALCRGLRVSG